MINNGNPAAVDSTKVKRVNREEYNAKEKKGVCNFISSELQSKV
jgi:hypothetical protein